MIFLHVKCHSSCPTHIVKLTTAAAFYRSVESESCRFQPSVEVSLKGQYYCDSTQYYYYWVLVLYTTTCHSHVTYHIAVLRFRQFHNKKLQLPLTFDSGAVEADEVALVYKKCYKTDADQQSKAEQTSTDDVTVHHPRAEHILTQSQPFRDTSILCCNQILYSSCLKSLLSSYSQWHVTVGQKFENCCCCCCC